MWSYWAVFLWLPSGDAASKAVPCPFVQQGEADLGKSQWISFHADPLPYKSVKRRDLWTNLLSTVSCRIPDTTLLPEQKQSLHCGGFSRFLSGLPCTELSPCRVSSAQPGVGDGAAWGEHQGLSPVAPGALWMLLTPCVQQGESSLSYVYISWTYLL